MIKIPLNRFILLVLGTGLLFIVITGCKKDSLAGLSRRTARFTLMALGNNTVMDLSLISNRYDLMIVSSTASVGTDVINLFRQRNPGAQVFCYFNTSDANSSDLQLWNETNPHEDWFHRDVKGDRVRMYFPKYSNRYAFNTGNPALQQYLANCVVKILSSGLYDGIQLDNVSTEFPFFESLIGNWISSVPVNLTPEQWTADEVALLKVVMKAVGDLGFRKTIIFNHMRSGEPNESLQYIDVTDGANCESWMSLNTTLEGRFGWKAKVAQVREVNLKGKMTNLLCTPTQLSENEALYCFASYLLAMEGDQTFFFYGTNYKIAGLKDGWYPFYDVDLGISNREYEPRDGAFFRVFSKGAVVVNPTQTPVTISLPQHYLTLNGQNIDKISLDSKQAAILLISK